MNVFLILFIIVIILCLILLWAAMTYNKYQTLIIKTNEVEANIDTILRKRFDLLNKSINIIKANIKTEDEILEIIVKLRSRKLSNFDLDRQLYEAINQFNYYIENYEELKKLDSIVKIYNGLDESEYEISAYRKYYNDTITDYNNMIRKIPSMILGKILKYKTKPYFDGKNTEDEIINDFKL